MHLTPIDLATAAFVAMSVAFGPVVWMLVWMAQPAM
jgi:hypothetical protein